ncbi:MAG: mannose-1-phosphate guanylyltransferase/mannose-6-phosphate isomerase [Xanthobacteraceae bacterium]
MPDRIIPLVMCGGAGTRLWPLSRERSPKQFLKLFGPRSMFQDTILRVSDQALFDKPIVVTGAAHRFLVMEQLAEIGLKADILLEPARRDSGPAIVAGATFAKRRASNAAVLALASDHVVTDVAAFVDACRAAARAAADGRIVTFGIQPTGPATEYGYISPGDMIAPPLRSVRQFIEKPDAATAARYIEAGYLWNSGNFIFQADVMLSEYKAADSASLAAVTCAIEKAVTESPFIQLDRHSFESATPISIDYAVMERTNRAAVVPVSCGWSDIGSWQAVWELSVRDDNGNAARGAAIFENSRNCLVISETTVVALNGVTDLAVVVTSDTILVSRRQDASGLKKLVSTVNAAGLRTEDQYSAAHDEPERR